MSSTVLRLALVVSAIALAMSFAVPVYATTYYGPSFVTPVAIPPGSPINIVLTTGSASTFVPPPTGSQTCTSSNGVCTYPLQSCTSATNFYYSIHEVSVTDPNGREFILGSAATSGLFWPTVFGGNSAGTAAPPHGQALNVTIGDSFTLPFGTGAEGYTFASFKTASSNPLISPPVFVSSTAGPYYWWNVTSASRLDLSGNNPTLTHGTYRVDVEGVVVCGGSTVQTSIVLFFDASTIVTTPQFGLGIGLVVAAGLVGLVVVKKKSLKLPVSTVVS